MGINTAVNEFFSSHFGRTVTEVEKDTTNVLSYKISALAEKIGTMKNGDKANYVVLTREDNSAIVMPLHPNVINKLLKNGHDSGMTLVQMATEQAANDEGTVATEIIEVASEVVNALPVVNEATTEVETAPVAADAVEAEVAAATEEAPVAKTTKKDRAIACYKDGHKLGKARKDIIAVFKTAEKDGGLGMSAPGANTYYQNIKSGLWS